MNPVSFQILHYSFIFVRKDNIKKSIINIIKTSFSSRREKKKKKKNPVNFSDFPLFFYFRKGIIQRKLFDR